MSLDPLTIGCSSVCISACLRRWHPSCGELAAFALQAVASQVDIADLDEDALPAFFRDARRLGTELLSTLCCIRTYDDADDARLLCGSVVAHC